MPLVAKIAVCVAVLSRDICVRQFRQRSAMSCFLIVSYASTGLPGAVYMIIVADFICGLVAPSSLGKTERSIKFSGPVSEASPAAAVPPPFPALESEADCPQPTRAKQSAVQNAEQKCS